MPSTTLSSACGTQRRVPFSADWRTDSSATYISLPGNISRKWSDSSTWHYVGPGDAPSPIPDSDANVIISLGSTVIVDQQFSVPLHTIRDDGILRFDPHANTSLFVDTLLVEPEGTFQMGTDPSQADPLSPTGMGQRIDADKSAKITFTDTGPIDLNWDPLQYSRGLVSHGDVSIFGSTVTSYEQLAVPAYATDKTLVLDAVPTGWRPGDRLVISGDTAPDETGADHDEEVQIVSITPTADGHAIVSINDPDSPAATAAMINSGTAPPDWAGLKFDHPVISGYVADVTRNAVFQSQSLTTISERGHVMFMHNDDVHVDGAGFYGLGRTDKRIPIDDSITTPVLDANGQQLVIHGVPQIQVIHIGTNPRGRYAVHFHRTGVDPGDEPASISDSAVVDTPGWGIVNHSSNVDVDGNVVFNAVGAAYATEAGDEIGRFDGNIAIHSVGSGDGIDARIDDQDFGHQGDGFWLQGGNVSVTNNIVAGQRGDAYAFYAIGLNQPGLGITSIPVADVSDLGWLPSTWTDSTIEVTNVPLRQFENNLAFASTVGLELRYSSPIAPSVIDNFTAFDVDEGIATLYTSNTIFRNVTLIGDVNHPSGTGFRTTDVTNDIVFDHVIVEGWEIGIDAPIQGPATVIGGDFNDVVGIEIRPAVRSNDLVDISGANFESLTSAALAGRQQLDVDAVDQYLSDDLTQLYDHGDVRPAAITLDGEQLYFPEQAADYVPFQSGMTNGSPIPNEFLDKTNAQLFEEYGLAIGGFVAPVDASMSDPKIHMLVGTPSQPAVHFKLLGAQFVKGDDPYQLSYSYYDPSMPSTDVYSNNVTVQESSPISLTNGWNLITRTIMGAVTTLLIYQDNSAPVFATGCYTRRHNRRNRRAPVILYCRNSFG